jgi:hypothetical protein
MDIVQLNLFMHFSTYGTSFHGMGGPITIQLIK